MTTKHFPTPRRPDSHTSVRSPFFAALLFALLLASCSDAPVMDDLSTGDYPFATEAGSSVSFPQSFAGRILVVSYIYTHCPDICIVTTSNLDSLRRALGNRSDVQFLSVSLDPKRDSPAVLREYADIHDIDTTRWHLLSGPEASTDSLLARIGFIHRKSFTTRTPDGDVYFIDHSDFITVLDGRGRLRGKFSGTKPDIADIVETINTISRESK